VAHVQPSDACTRAATFDYMFVNPETTAQFCAFVARSFTFADGDTVLAAQVRDVTGEYGPRREIVVRVTGFGPTPTPPPTNTPTATRVPSSTRTRTPTRTPTALPPCPGDCSGNHVVTVDEVLTGVNIALERAPLDSCANC